MKKNLPVLLCFIFLVNQVSATRYYVDALNGSNSFNGLTPATAFATLTKVSYGSTPLVGGDTVFIRNGIYGTTDLANVQSSFAVLAITTSGTPSAPIVFKNYPGESPLIQFNNWHGIYLQAGYIVIDGIRVRGNTSVIDSTAAVNQPSGCNDLTGAVQAKYNGNGITFDATGATLCHHVTVRNCEVWECCGGGIAGTKMDYITVENNKVHGNAWYSRYGNSGISLLHLTDYDNNTTTYRSIIRNNIVYDNELKVPWSSGGTCKGILDGNGIIIDDANNGQSGGTNVIYYGKTLIENNVVYNNGGRGIHVFVSSNVTVINNTVYANNKTSTLSDGEITVMSTSNSQASGNRVFNNVMYARSGKRLSSLNNQTSFIENNNLMYGSGLFGYFNSRDIFAAPMFMDTAARDFRLINASPGIDAGNDTAGNFSVTDITSINRPFRTLPDMGAYEYTGALPVRPTFTGGNLALLKVGDGTTLNVGSATTGVPLGNAVQVAEYTTGGAATGIIAAFPSTGADKFIIDGHTATYAGQLTLSTDGRYLSLAGFNADVSNDFTVLRNGDKIVARIDYALTLDTTTRFPNSGTGAAFVTTSVRGAASDNGSSFWVSANAIFRTITTNSKTTSAVPAGSVTARSVNRSGGNTFIIDQGDNSVKMHNGTVATALPGIPMGGNGRQSVLALDADPLVGWNGTVYDLVYVSVVNSSTAAGIQKYYFDNTTNTWLDGGLYNDPALGGTVTTGFYSLTGSIAGGKPEIYGIKNVSENNSLIKLTDNSGRTGNWLTATGGSATSSALLATAGNKYMFRGVAFTPTRYGNNPPQAIILPVKLFSFDAYLAANDAVINWATANEANAKEFVIERSSDGRNYIAIGRVAATNRSTGARYSYTDKSIGEGLFYYRLRSVDADGKTSLSKVVLINTTKTGKGTITLFPNPVRETLTVSYPALQKQTSLLVIDMAGRHMMKQILPTGSRQISVDVSGLSRGQYSVVIVSEDGVTVSKFIK